MPRPRKWKRVSSIPRIKQYGPIDTDIINPDTVVMSVEELESIRLMDMESLDQSKCADLMGIARSTFQRIYTEAKRKMADSIINGKILNIEGGDYMLSICDILCRNCGYTWKDSHENMSRDIICPRCESIGDIYCAQDEKEGECPGCRRHRMGRGRGHRTED